MGWRKSDSPTAVSAGEGARAVTLKREVTLRASVAPMGARFTQPRAPVWCWEEENEDSLPFRVFASIRNANLNSPDLGIRAAGCPVITCDVSFVPSVAAALRTASRSRRAARPFASRANSGRCLHLSQFRLLESRDNPASVTGLPED